MQVGCPEGRIDENVAKLTAAGYKVGTCTRCIPYRWSIASACNPVFLGAWQAGSMFMTTFSMSVQVSRLYVQNGYTPQDMLCSILMKCFVAYMRKEAHYHIGTTVNTVLERWVHAECY